MTEWEQGRWVRLTDGTIGLLRRVWPDGTCDVTVLESREWRENVSMAEIASYVERQTVWVDVHAQPGPARGE